MYFKGPSTSVLDETRNRMDCSGFTHGPPLPAHPGPEPKINSMPKTTTKQVEEQHLLTEQFKLLKVVKNK